MGYNVIGAVNFREMVDKSGLHVRSGHKQKAAAGIVLADSLHLLGSVVQRLFPAQPLPPAFPPLPLAQQRIFQPIRIIELFDTRIAAGT